MASVFPDIFEQTVVTEFVKREWEALAKQAGGGEDRTTNPASSLLPLRTVNGRHVKIRLQDVLPTGLAQFKAPGATPALWTRKPNLKERLIELVDIDEFHRVDAIDMLRLKSPDPNVLREAFFDLGERGAALQARNELRTEWMRWEALKGTLVVTYPNSASITVSYGIPAGHFPTMTIPWTSTATSNPVEDLWALGAVALSDAGIYLSKFRMNSATFRYMRQSKSIKDALSSYGRNVMIPTEADMRELLRDQSSIETIDSGYLPENPANKLLTKWIADGKVLATPVGDTYAGRGLGSVADGWVLVGVPGQEQPVARQGMQSEWVYNRIGQQTLLRQASARIPRIDAPEALAWGTAY